MFGRFSFWVLVLTFVSVGARAQYDPHFSHYYDMEASFNPAAVGKETKLNVVGAYAMNMVGFEHSPKTMYIGADMPFYALKSYHGAGINLMNDQLGLFQHQRLNIAYSNKQRLFGGLLGFGLQVGVLNESFKGSDVDLNETGDETIPSSDLTGNKVDLCAGLYYSHENWYVGASVQHLTSPAVSLGETFEFPIDRTYYLTGGYNIKPRNPFLTIPVTVFGQYDGVSYRTDITARVIYSNDKKHLYLGVGYSPTNSVTVLVGGSFHGINLGYSYEAYTNGISLGNGSHELFVSYQTELSIYKKGKNKHKSVRLL